MRIRLAVPHADVSPDVLNAALEAVTRTNEHLLDRGVVPTAEEAIANGVQWRPEPPGDEHFDHAETVMSRGHGDCDDLAPYHAASLRHTGEDPGAEAVVKKSGPNRWHAVVRRSDGSIEDPSEGAGMYEYRSPIQPRLQGPAHRPNIATRKIGPLWCARCDLPWRRSRGHALSGHAVAGDRDEAASEAIHGVMTVGMCAGVADPEHIIRLAALDALLRGAHPDDVRHRLARLSGGNVGSLFGSVFKAAKGLTKHIPGADLVTHIPGAGALLRTAAHLAPIPGAGLAYDIAEQAMHEGGGGHGGGHMPPRFHDESALRPGMSTPAGRGGGVTFNVYS